MPLHFRLPLILIGFSMLFSGQERACADTTTINFENLADGTDVGSTYAANGVIFNGAVIATAGESLNDLDFPPHSGVNVVFDANGPITLDFTSSLAVFSAFFTYDTGLTVNGYDSSNQLLASVTSLFSQNYVSSGNPANELISLNLPGIYSVTITGDPAGGSFVMDDVSFTTSQTSAAEPGTFFSLIAGFAFLAICLSRK